MRLNLDGLPGEWPEYPERLPMIERVKFLFAASYYGAEKVSRYGRISSAEFCERMWYERQRIFPEVDPDTRSDPVWMDED